MVYSKRSRHAHPPTLADIIATPISAAPVSTPPASIDAEHELSPAHQVLLEEVERMLVLLEFIGPRTLALAEWMRDNVKFEENPKSQ